MSVRAYRGQRRVREDPDVVAPFLPWDELYAYLKSSDDGGRQRFQQGDHVAVIGPTESGKTHLAFEVAEIREYVLVVACKPRDPLITDARNRGYHVTGKMEVPYSQNRPVHRRVIYWPRPPEKLTKGDMRAEKKLQRPMVIEAFSYVRTNGGWCFVIDEGTWICKDLRMQEYVDSALTQLRTQKVSVVILGQRPSWMGQYVLSQPQHLFLFQTAHGDDVKKLGDVSGVNVYAVRDVVAQLDFKRHEVLYVNTRSREMYRTIAPPR